MFNDDLSLDRVRNLLAYCFDRLASGHWLVTALPHPSLRLLSEVERRKHLWDGHWYVLYSITPLTWSVDVMVKDLDIIYTLTREHLEAGLSHLARKHPLHYQKIVKGMFSLEEADRFLQCSLFGEVRYLRPTNSEGCGGHV